MRDGSDTGNIMEHHLLRNEIMYIVILQHYLGYFVTKALLTHIADVHTGVTRGIPSHAFQLFTMPVETR
jgi:hypothetical protein